MGTFKSFPAGSERLSKEPSLPDDDDDNDDNDDNRNWVGILAKCDAYEFMQTELSAIYRQQGTQKTVPYIPVSLSLFFYFIFLMYGTVHIYIPSLSI